MNDSVASFVGRQHEMLALDDALLSALAGQGRMVMLAGEPGIGKTRTADEFAAIAEQKGALIWWGRCHEGEGAPPYWPWLQPIRSYVRDADEESLLEKMDAGASDIAEILPELRRKLPSLEPPPPLEPEQARFRLFDSITTFLKNLANGQPMVIILDDLHWADKSSLSLLEFVARGIENSPILLLGTYRNLELARQHPLNDTLAELSRHRPLERIWMKGLDLENVEQFVKAESGVSPAPDLVDMIYSRTEGNPLFVAETVRFLLDQGTFGEGGIGDEDSWIRTVPEGVKEVIGSRLNRLSDKCNEVLTIASVIGREFSFEELNRLIGELDQNSILDILDEALSAKLVEEIPDERGRCQFTHAMVQETLLSEVSMARRMRIHAQIAETLEDLYATDTELYASELAYHFGQASPLLGGDRHIKYSLIAGEQALDSYAWDEAQVYFQRVLTIKEGQTIDGDIATALFGLGRAKRPTLERHELYQAFETVKPAFDFYAETGDIEHALAIAEYPFNLPWGYSGRNELLAKAIELVPPDSLQAARLLCLYGEALTYELGDYQGAEEVLNRSLVISRLRGEERLEIQVRQGLGINYQVQQRFPELLEVYLPVVEMSRRLNAPSELGHALRNCSYAFAVLGQADKSLEYTNQLISDQGNTRHIFQEATALYLRALIAGFIGDWATARQYCDLGLSLSPRDVRLLHHRTILEYQLGESIEGEKYLDRLIETVKLSKPGPNMEYSILPETIGVLGRITGLDNHFKLAEDVSEVVLSSPNVGNLADLSVRIGLALIAVERKDAKEAEELYHSITPPVLSCMRYMGYYSYARIKGLLAHTGGAFEDATLHFEEALSFCDKAGYRPELAWTCLDYANCLMESDDVANHSRVRQLVKESLEISTELGMLPLVNRAASLKERLDSLKGRRNTNPANLTKREVEVLRLVASGKSNAQIASELVLSIRTVERHISNIYLKTNSRARADATAFAFTNGLMTSE